MMKSPSPSARGARDEGPKDMFPSPFGGRDRDGGPKVRKCAGDFDVKNYSGVGTVYDGEEVIAEVEYDLTKSHDRIDTTTKQKQGSMKGKGNVTGSISPTNESKKSLSDFPFEKLTLELEDGRKIDFLWENDPSSGSIRCSSGFYE